MPGTPPSAQSSSSQNVDDETVLAFDYGEKRLGVAVGDRSVGIAHPLETINGANRQRRFERIALLVAQWRPKNFVVGLPVNLDGSVHPLAIAVRAFAEELRRRFAVPAVLVDERFTSAEAAHSLNDAGVRGRAQKHYVDQVAAKSILEDYFANEQAGT